MIWVAMVTVYMNSQSTIVKDRYVDKQGYPTEQACNEEMTRLGPHTTTWKCFPVVVAPNSIGINACPSHCLDLHMGCLPDRKRCEPSERAKD